MGAYKPQANYAPCSKGRIPKFNNKLYLPIFGYTFVAMLTRQDILSFLRDNKEYLYTHFHLTKVDLFGSFARNEQKQDSDIDLLIERAPDAKNIFDSDWELQELLKKQFNRKVDICTEKYIKSYFKTYILKDVIYVWARQSSRRACR